MPFNVGDLHALRSTLAAHASVLGAPEEQIEHLLIVASELATNAIRHGGGTGRLRMWHRQGTLYCEVTDGGPGIADGKLGTERPDPHRGDAHRGLWICRNLAHQLTIRNNPDGNGATVTAVIARQDTG
jgi:anti-sigma regulatory factor (Ser/Thr protein kinase)